MAFVALLTLLLSAMALTATPVLGHTGSITAIQDCVGYTITAQLDQNVDDEATWEVSLNGTELDSGTGPGPATLEYTGAPVAGTAMLVIDFNDEHNEYTAELTLAEDCEEEEEPGTITIVKDTSPDAAVDFAFTTTGAGLSAFSLDDDADVTTSNQRTFTGLAAGAYTVAEAAATGYTLSTLSCTTGGVGDTTTRTATITLAAGQTVTCTFVNTVQLSATLTGTGGPAAAPRPALPNTAVLPDATGSTPAALGALLLLLGLGLGGYRMAEARRRR